MQTSSSSFRHAARRRGASSLEAVVAFTLLTSVLAFATPLVVRHGRLLAAQRDYRLALDEVSNQLERLAALPDGQIAAAVESLAPSPFIAARLSGVKMRGRIEAAEIGRRVTIELWWDEPQRRTAPVAMSAWIVPQQPGSSRTSRSDQP